MKKILFVSGVLLFLAGCSLGGKGDTASYADLATQFVQQNFSSPLFHSVIIASGQQFLRERLQLQIQGEDDTMSVQFLLRGQKDFPSLSSSDTMGSYLYDVDFLDKAENLPVRASGDVLYISQGGKEYLRTNTTAVDLGTGNAEGVMVQLIVDALSKKWLYIDKTGFIQTWMFSLPISKYLYTLPLGVNNLFANNLLQPWSQEPNGTYNVEWTYDTWNTSMPFTASSGFAFGGALGVKNAVPSFDLQRFVLGDWKGIGNVAGGKGNIVLQNADATYTIAWEDASYGAIDLVITYTESHVEHWKISGTLRQKSMNNGGLQWAIKGTISLLTSSASSHYIPLNFQANYALTNQSTIDIRVPTNTLLISQFFGDEFGLWALLNQ